MNQCPICDSEEIEYLGIDDGGGDYGMALCDNWRCMNCDYRWEDNCVEGTGEEAPDPEDTQIIQHPLFPEDKRSWDNYS